MTSSQRPYLETYAEWQRLVAGGGNPPTEPDPPGIVFLDPAQIYEFRSRPARRVFVSSPAGKPYVLRLANGEMLTAYTQGYHADLGRMPSDGYHTEVRWSADGGETWSEPVVPFAPERWPNTKEGTLVELADGSVLLFVHSGYRHIHTPTVSVSRDRGRTWDEPYEFDVSAMFPRGLAYCNRSQVPHPDGSVTLFFSNFYEEPYKTWGCVSRDGGRTHDEYWFVGEHIGDQSFLGLGGTSILAAMRIFGELLPDKSFLPYGYFPMWSKGGGGGEAHDYIAVTRSEDGGRTWGPYQPVTFYGEVPSHLLRLADGRILLTHGVRHYPMGAQAMLSADEGRTWDTEHRLNLMWYGQPYCAGLPDWGHFYPNGHPYSAQREDGKILTLYYRIADPRRYDSTVVEGVIWEVPR